jgi:pyridoxine kinase
VGNKSAVFPLNRLGFEVDAINSVQFSNHTGYPVFKGQIMSGEQLWELIEGLESNDLIQYTHLLTGMSVLCFNSPFSLLSSEGCAISLKCAGYIGSLSLLQKITAVAEKLRASNAGLVFVCDPVMGDNGRLYVGPELPVAYHRHILPISSIITPNQFEAELLSGLTITSEADALLACKTLHSHGPHTVIITSMDLPGWEQDITILGSTTLPQQPASAKQLRVRVPKVKAYFTGTGG